MAADAYFVSASDELFRPPRPPFGDNVAVFVATGTIPIITVSYLSCFMMISLTMTRPLLAFPKVKVLDVLFASALLEAVAASCVVLITVVLAWYFDIPAMPRDIVQAAYAFGASILLGIGLGVLISWHRAKPKGRVEASGRREQALTIPSWADLRRLADGSHVG